MKRAWVLALAGFVTAAVAAAALGIWASGEDEPPAMAQTTKYTSGLGRTIVVTEPKTNAEVRSPLHVVGKVPGPWSFEGSFGVEIQDANHRRVAEHYATVQGEWMTEADVPFTADVKFKAPSTDSGFLVLRNANPSADQSHDDSVEIPIRFAD